MTAESDLAAPATDGPAIDDPVTGRFMARQRRVVTVAAGLGVGLLVVGGLGLVAAFGDRAVAAGAVVLGILAGIAGLAALALLGFAVVAGAAYRRGRRQLDTASWRELGVVVLPEDADTRRLRTVADTPDGGWRLVIAKPSAATRDQLTRAGRLWYAGELADQRDLLVWLPADPAAGHPVGWPVHTAGVLRRVDEAAQ